jgi:hypothetical protein
MRLEGALLVVQGVLSYLADTVYLGTDRYFIVL